MRKVTEDFIGICQACFGEFKVNESSNLIVFHGYQRPGHGHTVGGCPGTDHKPFEYDCTLTKKIIGMHREAATKAMARLEALKGNEIVALTRFWEERDRTSSLYGKTIQKSEIVTPGHEHWDRTLKLEIYRAENDVIYHGRMADYFQMMVDGWKLGQIVGIDVPATGKSRALRKAFDPAEADAAAARAAEKAARDAKPGKLKVLFYVAEGWPSNDDDNATRRTFFETRDAERKDRITRLKGWVKDNITGKTIVREASDFDLPRAIRNEIKNAHVVSVHLPWEYLDRIADLLPAATTYETENKKRSFTMAGEPA